VWPDPSGGWPVNELLERRLLIVALVPLLVATILSLASGKDSRRNGVAAIIALLVAGALYTGAVAGRWSREDQGPFLTLYDVLLSNLCSLSLLSAFTCLAVSATRIGLVIFAPFMLLLGAWVLQVPAKAVPLPATFDNSWLWLHVLSGKIFLSLCAVPAAVAAALLLRRSDRRVSSVRVSDADAAIWPLLAFAFVCHSFMLIAGAVWAHSAWGRFWAWDPLETSALVTWLAIALLLHLRLSYRKLAPQLSWFAVVGIFALAFLTFFGVPFISEAPHKGVM